MDNLVNIAMILFTQVLLGGILAFTPYFSSQYHCFGVSIPTEKHASGELSSIKKQYRNRTLIATALTCTAAVMLYAIPSGFSEETLLFVGTVIITLILLGICYWHYSVANKAVKTVKDKERWRVDALNIVVAEIGGESGAISPWWYLIYIVFIALSLIIGLGSYEALPDQIPMHFNYRFQPDGFMEKSLGAIILMPSTQVGMSILLLFVHYIMVKSRKPIDPLAINESKIRYQRFTRAWSKTIFLLGACINVLFVVIQMMIVGWMSAQIAVGISMITMLIILISCVYTVVKYGQDGSKLRLGADDERKIIRDDDHFWKAGLFYYNPDDPALFVPKRFGIGWTNNFARPMSWILLIGLLALIFFSSILPVLL